MSSGRSVLDASALLAYLRGEPGAAAVEPLIDRAAISAVNWSEVVQKALLHGYDMGRIGRRLVGIGLVVEAFTAEDAELAAQLWAVTRAAGLSLADRACLALARRQGVPAVTAESAWLPLAGAARVEVEVIR